MFFLYYMLFVLFIRQQIIFILNILTLIISWKFSITANISKISL